MEMVTSKPIERVLTAPFTVTYYKTAQSHKKIYASESVNGFT